MNKQTLRMVSWAAGALLVTLNAFVVPGCGSDDSPGPTATSGSGGSTPTGGAGGSAGTSGTGGVGGSSATGGSGGTDQDAGGNAGTAGVGGEAGYGSAPLFDGGDAEAGGAGGTDQDAGGAAGYSSAPHDDGGDGEAGTGGTSGSGGSAGTGGTGGDAGSGGTSGTGGSSGTGGTAGTGGSNTGGTGGTIVVPCPADCSGHGSCDTSNGTCTCDEGFNTPDCGSCETGYSNYPTCYVIKLCPADCSGHGTCNDQTGVCSCDPGFDTASCGACASGYTGYPKCQVIPTPFTCVNPTRNAAFDSFKIDGEQADLTGGIWGTDASNVYVTAGSYSTGTVAHWNGSAWVNEALNPVPRTMYGVWGSSDNDVWVAATDMSSKGTLFHKQGGTWAPDSNQPNAWQFTSIWGTDATDIFVAGAAVGGAPKVWRRSGLSWSAMTTPLFPGPTMYYQVWGLDSNHVFVPGFYDQYDNGNNKGIFLYFDGNSWTSVQVPSDCRELRGVHGTSFGDLWVSGFTTAGHGVVYHVTNNLATWTAHANEGTYGYQPVLSVRAGTAVAVGGSEPLQAGNLKVTTFDQVNQPVTFAPDGLAYGPGVAIWYNAGKAWFVSISKAAVYTMDCN